MAIFVRVCDQHQRPHAQVTHACKLYLRSSRGHYLSTVVPLFKSADWFALTDFCQRGRCRGAAVEASFRSLAAEKIFSYFAPGVVILYAALNRTLLRNAISKMCLFNFVSVFEMIRVNEKYSLNLPTHTYIKRYF